MTRNARRYPSTTWLYASRIASSLDAADREASTIDTPRTSNTSRPFYPPPVPPPIGPREDDPPTAGHIGRKRTQPYVADIPQPL